MADDKTKSGPQDGKMINLGQDHERRYWTEALDIPLEKLTATVRKVGPSVSAVKAELWRDSEHGSESTEER